MNCKTCRYWDQKDWSDVVARCLYNPPQVVHSGHKTHTVWPVTKAEDGCAKYKITGKE